jgi:hypothetical protein
MPFIHQTSASTITGSAPAPRIHHNGSIVRSDTGGDMAANNSSTLQMDQLINFDSNGSGGGGGGVDIFEQQDMKYDSTGMFHWSVQCSSNIVCPQNI